MRILLLAVGLLLPVTLTVQQPTFDDFTRETQEWLFDEPSARYKLSASGRGVKFCSHTPNEISAFRLGCAERKDGELSILSEGDFEEWDLRAMKAGEGDMACVMWASFHGFPLRIDCEKGQFAVVEVKLKDGTTWKLKP